MTRNHRAFSPTCAAVLLGARIQWRAIDRSVPGAQIEAALHLSRNLVAQTGEGDFIKQMRVLLATIIERTAGCWSASLIATAAGEALYRPAGFAETNGRSTAIFIRSGMLARAHAN